MSPSERPLGRWRKPVLEAVVTLAAAGVLILAGFWSFQRRLIYFPVVEVPPLSASLPGARIVPIRTADGLTLTGWFLNGNAGNRGDRAPLARALADRGYEVLVFDYRGYGGNEGSPSEEGLALDAAAAVTALAELATVDRLIFLGESLGAAIAARLAVESPPTALVLRSPFPVAGGGSSGSLPIPPHPASAPGPLRHAPGGKPAEGPDPGSRRLGRLDRPDPPQPSGVPGGIRRRSMGPDRQRRSQRPHPLLWAASDGNDRSVSRPGALAEPWGATSKVRVTWIVEFLRTGHGRIHTPSHQHGFHVGGNDRCNTLQAQPPGMCTLDVRISWLTPWSIHATYSYPRSGSLNGNRRRVPVMTV